LFDLGHFDNNLNSLDKNIHHAKNRNIIHVAVRAPILRSKIVGRRRDGSDGEKIATSTSASLRTTTSGAEGAAWL
jgi:hypothetical protein